MLRLTGSHEYQRVQGDSKPTLLAIGSPGRRRIAMSEVLAQLTCLPARTSFPSPRG